MLVIIIMVIINRIDHAKNPKNTPHLGEYRGGESRPAIQPVVNIAMTAKIQKQRNPPKEKLKFPAALRVKLARFKLSASKLSKKFNPTPTKAPEKIADHFTLTTFELSI
jgi:hypothetical protein